MLGGGFTGLSSAYYIRTLSPQKRVVLLEAKGCGNGASGRNGAMVLNLTDDRYMQLVVRGMLWACDKLNDDYLKKYDPATAKSWDVNGGPQPTPAKQ